MKKTAILCMLTLALGFLIGILCNYSFIFLGHGPGSQPQLADVPSDTAASRVMVSLAPSQTDPPLNVTDNAALLQRSGEVLQAIKAQDYTALAGFVHPAKGVTFTPYSTVESDIDLCFMPEQIKGLATDESHYIWGKQMKTGFSIDLTLSSYFATYVFHTDYTQAPMIGVDTVLKAGNALENVSDAYPGARFVEYHFPGLTSANGGYDWCSLKLVFEEYRNEWMLVGTIHSEWTT